MGAEETVVFPRQIVSAENFPRALLLHCPGVSGEIGNLLLPQGRQYARSRMG